MKNCSRIETEINRNLFWTDYLIPLILFLLYFDLIIEMKTNRTQRENPPIVSSVSVEEQVCRTKKNEDVFLFFSFRLEILQRK